MAKAKQIAALDCTAAAGDGIRLALSTRLEEMCVFRDDAVDRGDPDAVHDMRVASRRLRSALRDFARFLPNADFGRVKASLKELATYLGEVRDLDVANKALEDLANEAPAEVSAGIARLIAERRQQRDGARAKAEKVITADFVAKLNEDFGQALSEAPAGSRKRKNKEVDNLSFAEVGRATGRGGLEELNDLSSSLYRPLKTKRLHRMRIAAKRLRYSLELVAPCWDEQLLPFAREIAKLQTALGGLHDCDLWIGEIGKKLNRSSGESEKSVADTAGDSPKTTDTQSDERVERISDFWLLDHFVAQRTAHLQKALAIWRDLELTGFQTRLIAILDSEPAPADAREVPSPE